MSWRDVVAQQQQQPEVPKTAQSWRDFVAAQGQNPGDIIPNSQPPRPRAEIIDMGGGAGMTALAKAAFVDDPETKLQIFAQARGIPPEQIKDRFLVDGAKIYFKDDQGVFRPENDQTIFGTQGLKEFVASQPAYLPAEVLSTAGGVAGAASPVPGGAVLGAGLGAAGGEGYRKAVGNLVFDEPQAVSGNAADMAVAAGVGATGDAVGRAAGKIAGKVYTRRAVDDVNNLDLARVSELTRNVKQRFGIDLTPGEATGLQSLLNEQWMLGQHPTTAAKIGVFLKNREPAIRRAVLEYVDGIAQATSPFQAGIKAYGSVQAYRDALKSARENATGAIYRKAMSEVPAVDVAPLVDSLKAKFKNANSAQQATISRILRDVSAPEGDEFPSLERLHNAKVGIDKMLKAIDTSGPDVTSSQAIDKRTLAEAKDKLLTLLEDASPTYATARQKFAEMSAPINQLENSLLRGFLKKDSDKVMTAVDNIFGPSSSPEAVMQARAILESADPAGWNNIVRAHLEKRLNALKDLQVNSPQNIGGAFRKSVFGSANDRNLLKAAMSPEQFAGLTDLMDVLEMTSRGFRGNSITVPAGEALSRMKDDAMAQAPALLKYPVMALNVAQMPARTRQLAERVMTDKYLTKLADVITSPDSLNQLRTATAKLRQANPRTPAYSAALGSVLALIASDPANAARNAEKEETAGQ